MVERRLAARAQISTGDSFYRWNDALCEAAEFRIMLKATAAAPALQAAVRELHPYELPEIVTQSLDCDDRAYIDWVSDNSDGR